MIDYRLLGPIEVRVDGQVLGIGGLKQRALLTMLLLRANEPVSRDVLVEQLWGHHPPAGAPHTIEVYVSRLRKVLAVAVGRPVVATRPAAYLLQVAQDELDVHRVERLAREGRHELAAGAPGAAAVKFNEALALWRGDALADLRYEPFFQAQISWLEEFRVGVFEDRIDADLALGRHAGLICELEPLIAAYPLRERLAGQLMVALCRCGRRGEALAAYDRARAVLAEELGLDPGPELRDLHARILVDDPSLTAATAVGALAHAGTEPAGPGDLEADRDGAPGTAGAIRGLPGVPRQLPAGAGFFARREAELKELDAILDQNVETDRVLDGASVVITAIGGMAGVGKTALAVEWARKIAGRFPDGQLYVNLRGYDPDATPVMPDEVTSWFLSALGVPAAQIPVSASARVGLYRSVLAERRVLIVLDNARNDAQVRPLLAGGPGCLVVVTSRSALTGLVASDGARPVQLSPLDADEAWQVLAARLGRERLASEPVAVTHLLRVCGGLPLALAITAARVAVTPGLTLAELAERLARDADRLDALDTGDEATTARTVFSWSFQQLSEPAASLFGLLGVHGGPDISLPAAASLAALPPGAARRALAELADASLVAQHRPGRYLLHDLLRSYAAEQARTRMSGSDVQAAILRSLDHYVHTAAGAPGWGYPLTTIAPALPGVHAERLTDAGELSDWLRSEHLVLMGAIAQASAIGASRQAWQIYPLLGALLAQDGHWADSEASGRIALDAATRAADYEGLGRVHRSLAMRSEILGARTEADHHNLKSLEYCQLAGDPLGQAHAHVSIAQSIALRYRGMTAPSGPQGDETDQGLMHAEQAADLFRQVGDPHGEGLALTALASFHCQLGGYEHARGLCRQALDLQRKAGQRQGQAHAWHVLADAHRGLGDYAEAARYYHQALDVPVDFSPRRRWYRALVLTHLGDSQREAGDAAAAHEAWQSALQVLEDLNHPHAASLRARLKSLADSASAGHNPAFADDNVNPCLEH